MRNTDRMGGNTKMMLKNNLPQALEHALKCKEAIKKEVSATGADDTAAALRNAVEVGSPCL